MPKGLMTRVSGQKQMERWQQVTVMRQDWHEVPGQPEEEQRTCPGARETLGSRPPKSHSHPRQEMGLRASLPKEMQALMSIHRIPRAFLAYACCPGNTFILKMSQFG